jgi:hypothetical protein
VGDCSPKTKLREGEPIKAFTAIGKIKGGEPYAVEMSECFMPTRRDVDYSPCKEVLIKALLDKLSFTMNNTAWGMIMRSGFFEISEDDFNIISFEMQKDPA